MATTSIEFPLVGAGVEPVDLRRTINSHGVTRLPPNVVDDETQSLRVTLALAGHRPRTVTISSSQPGLGEIRIAGDDQTDAEAGLILQAVRHIMRLDQDLSRFYVIAATDSGIAWATRGAGRMTRCPTVFEEVVKTICTTNCSWSATVRMVGRLVEYLGEPAPDAPPNGWEGRAFPTAAAMAAADDEFYRAVVRCGYRGAYLRKLATAVSTGDVDLEMLGAATPESLPDDELAKQLLTLPGVGPYAAAHIMTMLGRYSRLVLDSWTRPTYAKLIGREEISDAEIRDRFARYGPYAGLAFWLTITQDWLTET